MVKVLMLKLNDYIILILGTGFNFVIKVINKSKSCIVVITKDNL